MEGADGDEWEDYDRACDVDGHVGLIAVGQSHALVLGFDPASTAFLSSAGAFVRWIAADSEEELLDSVDAALASAVWEETVTWDVPGPVVLLDSACPGVRHMRANACGSRSRRVVTGCKPRR